MSPSVDTSHGRALGERYEELRGLVLAGAQSAPGLAVMRSQGMWAWLRVVEPCGTTPCTGPASKGAVPRVPPSDLPRGACPARPVHAQQVAQVWAQMILSRCQGAVRPAA